MADGEDAEIMTLKVCSLTSRYLTNGGGNEYLDRECKQCPAETPYSGGLQSEECLPCSQVPQELLDHFKLCGQEVVVEDPDPEPEEDETEEEEVTR